MGHVHLDPVRAMVQLFTRSLASFDRAIHYLHAFWHLQFRSIAFKVVTTGRRNSTSRYEQARAWNRAFFDGLLDFDVAVTGTFCFKVTQRGKPLFQRAAASKRGARRSQRASRLQDIGVVAAF